MKVHRIRIRQLPMGSYAVEYRRWPWSFWREETTYPFRAATAKVAMERAKILLIGGKVISHDAIVAAAKGETT
ncbi:hypothetical protein [Agrobacterium sp. MS2]|uniref:hypothetical protein n=1 Tax=Agrobacterium sp. MS2 TaxID=1345498 RepID=UPI000DBF9A89|nr:hypothetical protein [Agrobacterium sp. MS2]RAL98706.1 hypothetical protein DOU54_06515 [Agrobacterium sp. MS2]